MKTHSKALNSHVLRIAYLNCIHVRRVTRLRRVRSNRVKRRIYIQHIAGDRTYAQAMHELGHVLCPIKGNSIIVNEIMAWNWAIVNSVRWTKAMDRMMEFSIQSYINQQQSIQE